MRRSHRVLALAWTEEERAMPVTDHVWWVPARAGDYPDDP